MLNYKQIYCMELQLYDSLLLTSNVFLDMYKVDFDSGNDTLLRFLVAGTGVHDS